MKKEKALVVFPRMERQGAFILDMPNGSWTEYESNGLGTRDAEDLGLDEDRPEPGLWVAEFNIEYYGRPDEEQVGPGQIDWRRPTYDELAAFLAGRPVWPHARCSCDDPGDDPCPVHGEEMRAQNERIAAEAIAESIMMDVRGRAEIGIAMGAIRPEARDKIQAKWAEIIADVLREIRE